MRMFDRPITPEMSMRISKNSTIVDRILVSASIVYFLFYSILPPHYEVLCAISFLIITELLGSISQSLLSMSEQIRLSAILSAALQPKMSENWTESSQVFEKLDIQIDLNHLDETSYIGI